MSEDNGARSDQPWYRPTKGQAIFGWLVGIIALLMAFGQMGEYDGHALAPTLIGIVAIAWALGYRKA